MDEIKELWNIKKLAAPNITQALNKEGNEHFIVIDDDSTIIRMMNSKGQIYVVAGFRCKILTSRDGRKYYSCDEPLHPVTCKIENIRDRFVLEHIKPKLFKN